MQQNYSSANTSINKNSLPIIFRSIQYKLQGKLLDYGCGKYTNHIKKFVSDKQMQYYGYDKYNQPETYCNLTEDEYDIIVCSNVLNVIDSDSVIVSVLKDMCKCIKDDGVVYISIYQGNKSGIGKVSKKDCYQRNIRTDEYLKFCKQVFLKVKRKGNIIICNK